jgi:hypothetical protein
MLHAVPAATGNRLPSPISLGQGTLTLDVQTGKITLAHQENYTETRDSTREFDL